MVCLTSRPAGSAPAYGVVRMVLLQAYCQLRRVQVHIRSTCSPHSLAPLLHVLLAALLRVLVGPTNMIYAWTEAVSEALAPYRLGRTEHLLPFGASSSFAEQNKTTDGCVVRAFCLVPPRITVCGQSGNNTPCRVLEMSHLT